MPKTEPKLWRYPVFLKEDDWKYLLLCWEGRRRRIRSAKSVERYRSIDHEVSGASADAFPDEEGDMKYVLHLTEEDYRWLGDSLSYARKADRNEEAAKRIDHELGMACGDMTEVED